MKVEMYQRHLKDLQERFRLNHEQHLKQLQSDIRQTKEHNAKLIEKSKPQQHTVDVRA
jgi:hypothetical protein